MNLVDATSLEIRSIFGSPIDIAKIVFESRRLTVTLIFDGGEHAVAVKFDDVVGFRVLDEGDLLEYWPICSSSNGWLFRINRNGWFDLEASREGFLHEQGGLVVEYFISTQNGCVSVLAGSAPTVGDRSM